MAGQSDRVVQRLEVVPIVIENAPRFDRELVLEALNRATSALNDGMVAIYRETLIGLGALADVDEDDDEEAEGEST